MRNPAENVREGVWQYIEIEIEIGAGDIDLSDRLKSDLDITKIQHKWENVLLFFYFNKNRKSRNVKC